MLVGALELAIAQSAQQHILAVAQHRQIGNAVAVEVDRICAGDGGQVRAWPGPDGELERAAVGDWFTNSAGWRVAAGEIEVRPAVSVAVERGNATADEVVEIACVGVVDAGSNGLVHKMREPLRSSAPSRRGTVSAASATDGNDCDNGGRGDKSPTGQPGPFASATG